MGVSSCLAVCHDFPDAAASRRCRLAGGALVVALRSKGPRGRVEAGPAEGTVSPVPPGGAAGGKPGCARQRAGLRLPTQCQGSGRRLGLAGAPRARRGSGRFQAAAPASWAGRRGWEPGRRVCASDPGEPSLRGGVAQPAGETQTKVARPWRTRGHRRDASRPPRRHQR